MIKLDNLTVGYGEKAVLQNISLSLSDGELTVLLGANGCGKSTLIKTIVGLIEPIVGDILINGENLKNMSIRERAKKTAYLSQSRNTPEISAERMVLHGRFPYLDYPRRYSENDRKTAENAMKAAGAYELRKRSVSSLSGGERQRVYLAMALAQTTDNLLMDEPLTYLDVKYQLEMIKLAKKLSGEGKCVLTVLHDISLALRFSDRVIILSNGKAVFDGKPTDVNEDIIKNVFGVRLIKTEANGETYYFCE